MGTDIHLYLERFDDGLWTYVPGPIRTCWVCHGSGVATMARDPAETQACFGCQGLGKQDETFYSDRNYDVFAILADVRNGHGFAGVVTGDGFHIIAEPRGLPADVSPQVEALWEEIGDHTPSWLLVSEILAFNWWQVTTHYGTVSASQYIRWREKGGEPASYSGGVMGPGIVTVKAEVMDRLLAEGVVTPSPEPDTHPLMDRHRATDGNQYYTQVSWTESYAVSAARFLTILHEDIVPLSQAQLLRLVFWFDS